LWKNNELSTFNFQRSRLKFGTLFANPIFCPERGGWFVVHNEMATFTNDKQERYQRAKGERHD